MAKLYFGKISSTRKDQLDESFYSAGEKGSPWYGGIEPGDYVFPIYEGKVDRLWKVNQYGKKVINGREETAALFDIVKVYDKPFHLSFVTRYLHFEMNLDLLNKTSKSVHKQGFIPVKCGVMCPTPDNIDLNQVRRVYIATNEIQQHYQDGDIRILIDNNDHMAIQAIQISQNGNFQTYGVLWELYLQKNKTTKYTLKELLNCASEDGAPKKEKYLQSVIESIENDGFFVVPNGIAMYDNILVGRKVTTSHLPESPPSIEENAPPDEELDTYQKYIELLNYNPNIILYGPPGTGKTYSAIKIIEAYETKIQGSPVRYDEVEKQGRARFVTFHQAYSYEEFIEGIRPQLVGEESEQANGSLGYAVEDGILKKIAIAASGQQLIDEIGNTGDEIKLSARIWKVSLGRRNENAIYNDCKKNNCIALGWIEVGPLYNKTYEEIFQFLQNAYGNDSNPSSAASSLDSLINQMNIGDLVLIYDGPQTIRDIGVVTGDYYYDQDKIEEYPHRRNVKWIKEFKDKPADIFDYNGQIQMTQKSVYQLQRLNISDIRKLLGEGADNRKKKPSLPYYLVIDEINRGNIAKIFGELITLLEKDKREKIHCYLPYSKKRFTLPNNLFIIGTMNTADRSIALLDTALRRRFAFIEIEPDSNVFNNPNLNVSVKVNDTIDLPILFDILNERVSRELDRDHRIGHSYFINIINLNDLYHVWYYNIIPLLMEYFYNDHERLKRVIGNDFTKPDGSVRFLSTKSEQNLSPFEQAILKMMRDTQIDE